MQDSSSSVFETIYSVQILCDLLYLCETISNRSSAASNVRRTLNAVPLHRTAPQVHRTSEGHERSSAAFFYTRILSYKNKVVPLQAESIISRYCENNIGSPRRRPSSAACYLLTGITSLIFIPRM